MNVFVASSSCWLSALSDLPWFVCQDGLYSAHLGTGNKISWGSMGTAQCLARAVLGGIESGCPRSVMMFYSSYLQSMRLELSEIPVAVTCYSRRLRLRRCIVASFPFLPYRPCGVKTLIPVIDHAFLVQTKQGGVLSTGWVQIVNRNPTWPNVVSVLDELAHRRARGIRPLLIIYEVVSSVCSDFRWNFKTSTSIGYTGYQI